MPWCPHDLPRSECPECNRALAAEADNEKERVKERIARRTMPPKPKAHERVPDPSVAFDVDLRQALEAFSDEVKKEVGGIRASYPRCVYVIELSLPVPADNLACIYVGETAVSPQERFDQHRNAYKASRHVKQHGIRLRPDLYQMIPRVNTTDEARDVERRLAELLTNIGFLVKGGH